MSEQPDPEAESTRRERAAQKRRLAEVFGDVLPEQTADDRDPEGAASEQRATDDWLRAQVPPHHGG